MPSLNWIIGNNSCCFPLPLVHYCLVKLETFWPRGAKTKSQAETLSTAAPRRPATKVRRLPARLVFHVSSDATVIYNREPLGKASHLLTSSQAVYTLFRSLFRNAANDPQHGNSSSFFKRFFSCIAVAMIYLCLRAWLGAVVGFWLTQSLLWGGSGKGWRGREESQTKHESEGVSRSACERSGGLWERASLEKCPQGEN